MTDEQVAKLQPGDEVYWNDPDEGACSRVYKIRTIEVLDEIVVIEEPSGAVLECFAKELS
jgi:hypothetical protein